MIALFLFILCVIEGLNLWNNYKSRKHNEKFAEGNMKATEKMIEITEGKYQREIIFLREELAKREM